MLARAHAESPLRLLSPVFPGCPASVVCLVTFGGGLVDGDGVEVDIVVERGATLVVFTQATTKVFRGASWQSLRARVAGTLVLVPDPVACFRGARFRQRVEVALEGEGACVLLDGFTSGRPAYGDRWAFDLLDMRTTVAREGALLVHDAVRLDRAHGPVEARVDRLEAFATLLAIGERVRPITRALVEDGARVPGAGRDLSVSSGARDEGVVVAPSSLASARDGAIVRIAGPSPAGVMGEVRRRLRNLPDIDAVDPFGARH